MTFPYQCSKCGKQFDGDYPIGKAPRVVPCPSCGGSGKRVYGGMSLSVRVSGGSGSTFGEKMKRRNVAAAERMKGRKPPVRLKAYDYGNGDVRPAGSG